MKKLIAVIDNTPIKVGDLFKANYKSNAIIKICTEIDHTAGDEYIFWGDSLEPNCDHRRHCQKLNLYVTNDKLEHNGLVYDPYDHKVGLVGEGGCNHKCLKVIATTNEMYKEILPTILNVEDCLELVECEIDVEYKSSVDNPFYDLVIVKPISNISLDNNIETVEGAANECASEFYNKHSLDGSINQKWVEKYQGFIAGYEFAKTKTYSEEELKTISLKMMCNFGEHISKEITGNKLEMIGELMKINSLIEKWFNDFKKK
jgi:hypothetical protein